MDGSLGGKYTAEELANIVNDQWPADQGNRYVVCTGGEPLLQLDEELINAFHAKHFEVGVETNGTITPPTGLDWICVSPKANTDVVLRKGNELKLVVRQKGIEPDHFTQWEFDHFYLQPMDGSDLIAHTKWALDYCLEHPQWKLSVQTHKWLGIR
jgi:7-carboxy-7-deazaguanine synthase (Cx14CxxC type)